MCSEPCQEEGPLRVPRSSRGQWQAALPAGRTLLTWPPPAPRPQGHRGLQMNARPAGRPRIKGAWPRLSWQSGEAKTREMTQNPGDRMGKRQDEASDSDQRTGTHISEMSHKHSFGQATPTAARTLNIGTRHVSFRKGLEGGGGVGGGCREDRAPRPGISLQGHLQGPHWKGGHLVIF